MHSNTARCPARERVQVHSGEPKSRWDERRAGLTVRPKRLSVHEQLGVELSRTPAVQHVTHRRLVGLEQTCDRAQVGRERDDCADIQVSIRPPVEAVPNTRSKSIVDSGVTERTLHAD